MKKWTFEVSAGSIALIILGTVINLSGRWLASSLSLPLWLDSIGTFLTAILLGPVAGAISGALMNVVANFYEPGQIWFAIVSIIGGLAVGRFFPRDRKIDSFSVIATALFAGFVMVIVSTPLNLYFNSGFVGNEWGDALVKMMSNYVNVKLICCVAGELFINMPDKAVSIVITMGIIYIVRKFQSKKNSGDDSLTKNLLTVAILIAALTSIMKPVKVLAAPDFNSEYASVIYGMDDGLVSAEMNTVAQTSDGYIWAGAYSGLYRYNGLEFEQVKLDDRINNVIYLFEDSKGKLWIGTNDGGVACYDPDSGNIKFYSVKEGLAADSIRSICEDDSGNIYVSTTAELCRISENGDIHVYSEYPDISCVYSLKNIGDGRITGVTANGQLFIIQNDELIATKTSSDSEVSFTSVAYGDDGDFLVGTSSDELIHYHMSVKGGLTETGRISLQGLNYVNHIVYSKEYEGYFVAASVGLFFVDNNDNVTSLSKESFGNSVTDAIIDYQDNIWFASSKQGIMKMAYNPFADVFSKAGMEGAAVNALLIDAHKLYVGTDTGLLIIDVKSNKVINDSVTGMFDGVRIRHLLKDSSGNIWVSTYGTDGLVCIDASGEAFPFEAAGLLGTRFRFTMELSDGTILAASTEGLNFINDGKIIDTIGAEDGLSVPQILSAIECPDGTILAGSDGGGIYKIKNGEITGVIAADEGLESLVILRIVSFNDEYLYVTSNGLYCDDRDGKVRRLKAFPYNNNYDIYITGKGEAWVSSSAGIFVVDSNALVEDKDYQYILLNHTRGFDTTLTANAWNAVEGEGLYLCCTDGVRYIDTATYNDLNDNYNIVLSSITDEDEEVPVADGIYSIPSGNGRLQMAPAVLDYGLSNPLISLKLKGADDQGMLMHQTDMTDLYYTSLPYGDYELQIKIIDELTGAVKKEKIFKLHKDAELYERLYFKIYLIFVSGMLVAFFAWMIAKMGNMAVINRQYEQIREAKEEAELANKAKSRFLANMSHEIRTPINAVLGMDEMILRESSEKEIRGYASDIYTAGNTLLSLINDILDSSKIESGKMEIVPVEYELTTLIRDLYNMISGRARAKDLTLTLEVDDKIPKGLYGDDVRIRQVITNILTNAVKYTPAGTVWFRVKGRQDGEDEILHIEVEDTGTGIKEEDLPKLFEAYQRIEEGKNRNIEGTGLGMNITIQLLDMMGSKLEVESVYGKGSKFFFDIRQKIVDDTEIGDFNSSMHAPEERYSYEQAFVAPDARVLVVDDNAMNRKVFRSLLKVTGIQVTEAGGGAEALEIAAKERFHMVFMDHMMPDMDGVETMQRMRDIEGYDAIPIYVLTANAVTGAKEQYLEAGFDGFISKPIVSDKLEQALKDALPTELIKPYEGEDRQVNGDGHGSNLVGVTGEGGAVGNDAGDAEGELSAVKLDDLPGIDGMDWNYAWMHLPDMELLEETVKEFHQVIGLQADKLDRMWKDISKGLSKDEYGGKSAEKDADNVTTSDDNVSAVNEMLASYRIQVHGMKSAAATIGIVPLAGMAKILEYAARDGDVSTIEHLHDVFLEEWKTYEDKLSGVFGIGEEQHDNEDKVAADSDMLSAMMEMLKNALEEFDVDAADGIMEKIKSYSYTSEVEALIPSLSAAVSDLDQDTAEEIMHNIEGVLDI